MKILYGVVIGATIMILWHALGWPLIGWAFTRIPPAHPADWNPKHRRWARGIEVTP